MRSLNRVPESSPVCEEKSWIPELHRSEISRSLGIYPRALFLDLVRHERLRCDRLDTPLSLIVIPVLTGDAAEASNEGEIACTVVSLLVRRVRGSDSVGWLDSRRIAVLLPATSLEGARRFVALLLPDLPRQCKPVEVSAYPQLDGAAQGGHTNGAAQGGHTNGAAQGGHTQGSHTGNGRTNGHAVPAAQNGALQHEPAGPGYFRVYDSEQLDARNENSGTADRIVAGVEIEHIIVRPVPRWKRAIDVAGALAGLTVCVPVFLVVAAQIKLVSPGPILFTQQRVGRGGRPFTFFKFRTMHCNNDQSFHNQHAAGFIRSNGAMTKLDDADPRIIPGGRVLRVLCIDELPQLYNVLRGDMSLVGPRPCIPYEAAEYQRWHRHRFSILPGLTGLWQVSGKNRLSFAEMIKLDIAYERTMSPVTDLVIILRTIPTIFGLLFEAIQRRLKRRSPEGSNEEQRV